MNSMKKEFNKLVRDKIPEIILKNGGIAEYQILQDEDYIKKLDDKLLEECKEVLNAKSPKNKIEEIADLVEVLGAIIKSLKVDFKTIEDIRLKKRNLRGGFDSKIFLKSATIIENFN